MKVAAPVKTNDDLQPVSRAGKPPAAHQANPWSQTIATAPLDRFQPQSASERNTAFSRDPCGIRARKFATVSRRFRGPGWADHDCLPEPPSL